MPVIFASPGTYSQEIDSSFSAPVAAAAIGAVLVGPTQKGPAYIPKVVRNNAEFRNTFGSQSPSLYTPYAAKSYLRNSNNLTVVRTLGRGTAALGTSVLLAFPTSGVVLSGLTASNTVLGVLRFRGTAGEVFLSGSPTNFSLAVVGSATANGLSMVDTSAAYIRKVLGTDPVNVKSGDSLTALYVDAVFDYNVAAITGSVSSGVTANASYASATAASTQVTGGFTPSRTPMLVSQNYNGLVYNLFQIFARVDGNSSNGLFKVSVTNVDTSSTSYPNFTVVIRDFNDTDVSPVVIESYTNINLDPNSKNYVARVIGDKKPTYDFTTTPPTIVYDGNYENKSDRIRVEVQDGFPAGARPSGYTGVQKFAPVPAIASLPTVTSELNSQSVVDNNIFMGVDFTKSGVYDRTKATITSASAGTINDTGLLFYALTADYNASGSITTYTNVDMAGSNSGNYSSTNPLRFTVPMWGGFDGYDPRVDSLSGLNDGTTSADFVQAINILSNQEETVFNLIAVPGVHSSSVQNIPQRVVDMVSSRGDAFYVLDLADTTTTGAGLAMSITNAVTEAAKYDTNYAAGYFPWIRINDTDNNKIVWVPPSVEVMGAYAFNDRIAQPWWAPAGFNRGGLENVLEVRRKLTQTQRDQLYLGRVNPVANFPGQGIVIWGQKTLQKKESLLTRINIRRLMITVRKTIANFSRLFVFQPNDATTRSQVLGLINNYLSSVQSARGLTQFRAILDETTTTPDLIDRNIMKGKILLQPTSTAEVILLDFQLSANNATFSD